MERATDESDVSELKLAYREEYRLPSNRTVTIICVVRPDKILNQLQKEIGFVPTNNPGIYHCDDHLPQWIIHPDELDLIPENYPLLALSRGKKLAAFIDICIQQELTHYLDLAIEIGVMSDPLVTWQKVLEVKQMEQLMTKEVLQVMDKVFQRNPQLFMDNFTVFRDTLEDREETGFKRGTLHTLQQMLIRQLYRHFKEIPTSVVQRVESTQDRTQLESWLDEVFTANSLAEMGLLPAEASTNGATLKIDKND